VAARIAPALCIASLLAGCAGAGTTPPAGGALGPSDVADSVPFVNPGKYIKHVIIVVQENRSFDNLFDGFPGADTSATGYMHDGTQVALQPIPFEVHDMDHYYQTGRMDYDGGKMDGFDLNGTSGSKPAGTFPYSYLERSAVQPYWTIAQQYVLADHMFPTMFGPSFTAHLTLIGGTADLTPTQSEADFPTAEPWGCDAPSGTVTATVTAATPAPVVSDDDGPFPCFNQFRTLAATLDAKHVSWKYYAPAIGSSNSGRLWSSFDAIRSVRDGPDWKTKVISPPTRIIHDALSGHLAAVSWVVPDFLWSDHPYAGTPYGPSWVAAVVNAAGASPDWKSTAIVVVWDDWGGFYDNVPPPQLDFRGLGIRVGCLIVSPYVKARVVHTQYEFGSILKFVEQTFDLPPLGSQADGYTDTRAKSIVDSFDFMQAPRSFTPISAPYPRSFFIHHAASFEPPDSE